MSGILITLEGGEGTGKSTQLQGIANKLKALGHPFIVTKEPGGSPVGLVIRQLLLTSHPSGEQLCHTSELLLFYADRAQHLSSVIYPALKEGKIVLCDRFDDSSWAYQGARGVPDSLLQSLQAIALAELPPYHTIFLDMEPAAALQRVFARNAVVTGFAETRFDNEVLEFHIKVHARFRELAQAHPERITVVDASNSLEQVREDISRAVDDILCKI